MTKNIVIVFLTILCLALAGSTATSVYYYIQTQREINNIFQENKDKVVMTIKEDIVFTGVGIPDKLLSSNEEVNINMAQKHLSQRYYNLRTFDRLVKVSNHTVFVFRCPAVDEIEDDRLANAYD